MRQELLARFLNPAIESISHDTHHALMFSRLHKLSCSFIQITHLMLVFLRIGDVLNIIKIRIVFCYELSTEQCIIPVEYNACLMSFIPLSRPDLSVGEFRHVVRP